MKQLYTYLVEKQGYLDYDAFIDDIMYNIYTSEETVGYIFKKLLEQLDCSHIGIPEWPSNVDIGFFNFNIKVKSDNYPYWLKELYIKSYKDVSNAAVDTDLIVIDNDKKTLKSATIYINIYEFFIFDIKKYIRSKVYDEMHYPSFEESMKVFKNVKKTLKFNKDDYLSVCSEFLDKNTKSTLTRFIKDTFSHELKHLFDYYIAHYKQNINLIKDWDNNSYIKIPSQNEDIESLFSDLLYFFDKRELSAFQQQLISQIKHSKNNKDLINDLNATLKLIINSNISTFPKDITNTINYNMFNILMCELAKNWDEKFHKQNYEEICYIIKEFKLSEKILGKKFNGKTREDFNKFLEQCFNKIKNIYINILKKATKHLV